MTVTDHSFPTDTQQVAFAQAMADGDGPIVMLNLNRYRDVAVYGDERDAEGASGRDVYLRYGIVAQQGLERVGAKILWATDTYTPLIGCEHDAFDEVLAVWYPSRAAFLDLTSAPDYVAALEHRQAALDWAALVPCHSGAEAALTNPFDV